MKRISIISALLMTLLFGGLCLTSSCKDKKQMRSLSKMLKEEKRNIEKFINEQQLTIKEGSVDQKEFEENVYYHFPNNLYMRVLDKGTTKPKAGKTHVVVRYKGHFFSNKRLASFDNLSVGDYQNTEFLYVEAYERGALHYRLLPSSPGNNLNKLMCEGVAFPLSLLGDGAKISLIVPFLIGPEVAYNAGMTVFYEEVRFQFYIP